MSIEHVFHLCLGGYLSFTGLRAGASNKLFSHGLEIDNALLSPNLEHSNSRKDLRLSDFVGDCFRF